MRKGMILVVGIGVLACSVPLMASQAEDGPSPEKTLRLYPLLSGGLTQGGDTIATYRLNVFDDEFDADLNAGEVFFIYAGVNMLWPRKHLGLQFQGGFFLGGAGNYEQSVDFLRWPIEVIGFGEWKKVRAGVGLTHHFSPTFEDKDIAGIKIEFDDATGWLLQVEYVFRRFSVGVRRVQIEYVFESNTLNGDHWGLVATWRFGKKNK